MSGSKPDTPPGLPPRFIIRLFRVAHRRFYRLTGGRLGLWRPKPGKWGTVRLTTIGRKTGREHAVIGAYASRRSMEPAVVVLEQAPAPG